MSTISDGAWEREEIAARLLATLSHTVLAAIDTSKLVPIVAPSATLGEFGGRTLQSVGGGYLQPAVGSGTPCTEGPCPTSITSKVNLIIITESGCPPCQSQIIGPINDMITSPGFADILNVRQFRYDMLIHTFAIVIYKLTISSLLYLAHFSFGNNYFATNICGGNPIVK